MSQTATAPPEERERPRRPERKLVGRVKARPDTDIGVPPGFNVTDISPRQWNVTAAPGRALDEAVLIGWHDPVSGFFVGKIGFISKRRRGAPSKSQTNAKEGSTDV